MIEFNHESHVVKIATYDIYCSVVLTPLIFSENICPICGTCKDLHATRMASIRLIDLQNTIDKAGKNYPTLKKIKILFNQLYEYCMKYEIISKDYSRFVNIEKHRNLWKESNNDNKRFSIKEIALL